METRRTEEREKAVARLSVDEALAIARDAYVFGLPLVYFATQADVMTYATQPKPPLAPVNQFAHFREFPTAANKEVVGLNVDTLYSLATLDVTAEPIILSIPEMGDRWWLMQLLDSWNDVFAAPGARTVGPKGGRFAIVGPSWKGKLPDGVTECRSDTSTAVIAGRTYTAGKADYEQVHELQSRYRLIPLSHWGTDYTLAANVPLESGVDAKTPVPGQVFGMSAERFFAKLSRLLPDNPARAADAPMLARMARLGVVAGVPFSMERFGPKIRDAIERGVAAGRQAIRDEEERMGDKVNGWQLARDLGRYGTRYTYRAAWTYFGVGGNLAEDAFYPLTLDDSDGKKLSGHSQYVLHFAESEIPPVHAFWSLTLYDAESYLSANALDRYSRGDRDPLRRDDDGSLTLYIQHDSPGPDKASNWLPAPEEAFKLALRLYWPKPEVVDGTWKPPGVQRVVV